MNDKIFKFLTIYIITRLVEINLYILLWMMNKWLKETNPSWWLNIQAKDQHDNHSFIAIIVLLIKDHKEHQFVNQKHNKNKQIQYVLINRWNQWKAQKVTLKIIKNKRMNLVVKGKTYPRWCWLIRIIKFSIWLTLSSL